MKKKIQDNKTKYIHYGCIILFLFVMMLLPLGFDSIFGSKTDWIGQHTTFADYFRMLFYNTGDLFPDYAFHIGGGNNIYFFSYYGLLNPLLMLSYLFPFISMSTYIMLLNIVLVLITGILLYEFLLHKKYSNHLSLLVTLIMMSASFLIFHAHRHYMFMNYMPFLILALFGVDRYFETKKKGLFIFSVFMMIMLSYYYSVTGILVCALYTIACVIKSENTYSFKKILQKGYPLLLCTFLAIMMACVLLLPTASVILSGRGSEESTISLLSLLVPSANLDGLLYDPYTLGVTATGVVAIFASIFSKKKEQRFLSISFLLILCFPIFVYILNGTLYVREKILFPFFPILALFPANLLHELENGSIKLKPIVITTVIFSLLAIVSGYQTWIYYLDLFFVFILLYATVRKKNIYILGIGTLVIAMITCFVAQLEEDYPTKDEYYHKIQSSVKQELIEPILEKEDEFVRMNDRNDVLYTVNKVYSPYSYRTSIYSSTYNKNYVDFLRNDLKIAYASRNPMILKENDDIFESYFLGVKYIVSTTEQGPGYKKIAEKYDKKADRTYYLYENENVLPVLYGRSQTMNVDTYQKLDYPENVLALLQYTMTEDSKETPTVKEVESLEPFDVTNLENVTVKQTEEETVITAQDNASFRITLPEDMEDDLIIFEMDITKQASCENGDLSMTIEGVENKLTCQEWQYQNYNHTFHYVISHHEHKNYLEVTLKKGTYHFKNIQAYQIPSRFLESVADDVTVFHLNKEKTKGDHLEGNITMTEDGYFVTSIPYDKGFTVYVDGKEIEYETVNQAFLGFPLEKGKHQITFTYEAPLKKEGMMISIIGFILFIGIIVIDKKKEVR